jgi:hypothetical protein
VGQESRQNFSLWSCRVTPFAAEAGRNALGRTNKALPVASHFVRSHALLVVADALVQRLCSFVRRSSTRSVRKDTSWAGDGQRLCSFARFARRDRRPGLHGGNSPPSLSPSSVITRLSQQPRQSPCCGSGCCCRSGEQQLGISRASARPVCTAGRGAAGWFKLSAMP